VTSSLVTVAGHVTKINTDNVAHLVLTI